MQFPSYHQKYMLQRHPALCNMLDLDPSVEGLSESHVACRVNGYVGGFGDMANFEAEYRDLDINEKCAAYLRNQRKSACSRGVS